MELKEILERMNSERIYLSAEKSLMDKQLLYIDKLYDFNNTRPTQMDLRQKMMKEMFAEIGENCYIEPPLHSNFGCHHVHFGNEIYANFNLTLVDDADIYVGDHTMFGPNVVICTATHPISPRLREVQAQYNKPVHIGRNVWIGANVFVMPGVTIGDNSIVGAGSVVTKDVPSNVIVVGNPAHILRKIDENDEIYYDHNKKIDI